MKKLLTPVLIILALGVAAGHGGYTPTAPPHDPTGCIALHVS